MSWQTITTINNENRLYWGWVNHQEGECLQREPRGTSLMQPQSAFSSPQEEAVGWGRWPLKTFILYCSIFSCVWRFWQDCGYLGRRRRLPEALLEGTSVSIRSSELHSIVIPCWVLGAGCWGDSRLRSHPWSWHLCGEGQTSHQQWRVKWRNHNRDCRD